MKTQWRYNFEIQRVGKKSKKEGCRILREGASHCICYSPLTGKAFPVSRHKTEEVPTGTLKFIAKDAGL
ncbi:MAG: type II toxin-antitoxin system HicA family toxin [Lachnospiraceae bacterium]|nr:type II toxin-antitoxin system HicA family toxin [Lachnospiraceae bacterium]